MGALRDNRVGKLKTYLISRMTGEIDTVHGSRQADSWSTVGRIAIGYLLGPVLVCLKLERGGVSFMPGGIVHQIDEKCETVLGVTCFER
jgi:hypothetical protein